MALSRLPQLPAEALRVDALDRDRAAIDLRAPLQYQPQIIASELAKYPYGTSSAPATAYSPSPQEKANKNSSRSPSVYRPLKPLLVGVNSSFGVGADQDVGATTNGTYIVQTQGSGTFRILTMSGAIVQELYYTQIYCGAQPLPICSQNYNPGPGDNRVIYDPSSQRWVMSSLWVDAGINTGVPPTASLAISKTSDPTGSWYIYQFPNCGSSDANTIGDQPRLGFNNQWIVVTSSCSLASDASLDVFDKNNLYAGGALSLNSNWWQFADSSNVNNKDNPADTYVPTINNREYLTFVRDDTTTGKEQVVYSHIEGSVDAPVFYSETDAVDTTLPWTNSGLTVTESSIGCSACIGSWTNGTIQSSDVFQLSDGNQYILTTNAEDDSVYANANDLVAVAMSSAGTPYTLELFPNATGTGTLGSEIGMPLSQSITNTATVAYEYSSPSFYPGAYVAQWNILYNRLDYNDVLQQGNVVPTPLCSYPNSCTADRFVDFTDAFAPIPGSSQFVVESAVASSAFAGDREGFFANLSQANVYPCDYVGGSCSFQVSWPAAGDAWCDSEKSGGGYQDNYTGSGQQFVASPSGLGTLTQNISAGTATYTRTASGTVTIDAQEQYEYFSYSSTGFCLTHYMEYTFNSWTI